MGVDKPITTHSEVLSSAEQYIEINQMPLSTQVTTAAWLLSTILVIGGCSSSNSSPEPSDPDSSDEMPEEPTRTQFLYTQTNDARGNQVVGFAVNEDGNLVELGVYDTASVGDADEGDFDSQSSVRVYEGFLLVANPGDAIDETGITDGNSAISVFSISEDGSLQRIDQDPETDGIQNADSQGIRAVSLDFYSEEDTTWVAVANQGANRVCVSPEQNGTLETCTDQFGNTLGDLLTDESPAADIQLFTLSESGILTHQQALATFAANRGGPSQVAFSPDGSKLSATLLGIPHLSFPADPANQQPSRTYLWDFDATAGTTSNQSFFEHPGIAGSIGFGWSPDSDFLYVSSATLDAGALEANVVALDSGDTNAVFTSDGNSVWSGAGAVPTAVRPAACWVWVNAAADRVYTVGFLTNTISTFETDGADMTHLQTVYRQDIDIEDAKDIVFSADGKYAYVLGAFFSHTISIFDVNEDGTLSERTTSPLAISASRTNGVPLDPSLVAYQGLDAYPSVYVGY